MTWPREGSRETHEGIIISEPMDWCKSPTAIVPYRLYAYQREATDLADSVRQTSDRTHVKDSIILASYGDEPGVGGGVLSGTHNAECTPKTWSQSVTAEGRNVVRHDDEWWMNHKNTWGRLQYVKDTSRSTDDAPMRVVPKLEPSNPSTSAASPSDFSATAGQQYAQGFLFEAPMPRIIPPGTMPRLGPVNPRIGPRIGPGEAPEPKPLPMPRPNPDPGLRTTGCRSKTICFKSNGKDQEYKRQLKFQEDALNAKSACDAGKDIDKFDGLTQAQKQAQRALANKAKGPFIDGWTARNPNKSLSNLDALHRLDMVAGGSATDFADMGDSSVNQSIGPEWKADTRKGELKRYADEMCKNKCPMAVKLDLCDDAPAPSEPPSYDSGEMA